jgi:GNAT superfamily N-acetyltransferase
MERVSRITLAPFARRHAAGTVDVIRAVFDEYAMTFDLEDFDRDLQDIPEHYAGQRGAFWVLLDGDRVVGTVAVAPKDGTTAELKRLYLLSAYRGAGHGRRLVEEVIAWTRAAGYPSLVAWSDVRLGTAHQVYCRVGFRRIGERTVEDIDRSREYGFVFDVAARPSAHEA